MVFYFITELSTVTLSADQVKQEISSTVTLTVVGSEDCSGEKRVRGETAGKESLRTTPCFPIKAS